MLVAVSVWRRVNNPNNNDARPEEATGHAIGSSAVQ
jgi:hypothetical protein